MKEKKRLDHQQRIMAAGMLWMAGVVLMLACEQWLPAFVAAAKVVMLALVLGGIVVLLRYWWNPAEKKQA